MEQQELALEAANKAPEAFVHEPLDIRLNEIRLLRLEQRLSKEEPIRATVVKPDPHARRRYIALSYVWGAEQPKRDIILNGKLFQVRQNLYDFLDHETTDETAKHMPIFWIDQICIDQSNIIERNHQVKHMAEIYRRASYVHAWLGTGDPESEQFMNLMKMQPTIHISVHQDHLLRAGCSRLEELNNWQRLWVTQEILLAESLYIRWGYKVISWDGLLWSPKLSRHLHMFARLHELHTVRSTFEKDRISRRPYGMDYDKAWSLLYNTMSSEPRDRVYALLGIIDLDIRIEPDYSKSLADVHRNMMQMQARQSLDYETWSKTFEKWTVEFGLIGVHPSEAEYYPHVDLEKMQEHLQGLHENHQLHGRLIPEEKVAENANKLARTISRTRKYQNVGQQMSVSVSSIGSHGADCGPPRAKEKISFLQRIFNSRRSS